jgi:HAD superfamily hydrolase (TIGR01509 family)
MNAPARPQGQWVIIGGGRLGQGYLSMLASKAGMRARLFVAGEQTSALDVEALNDARDRGDGYIIHLHDPYERIAIHDFEFTIAINTGELIAAIADRRTEVISTSVGFNRMSQLALVVAAGLQLREADADAPRLLVLVCENGMTSEGLSAAEYFAGELEKALRVDKLTDPGRLKRLAEIPRTAIDVHVPNRLSGLPSDEQQGGPAGDQEGKHTIQVGRGTLWVEQTPLAKDLLRSKPFVHLVEAGDGKEIRFLLRRKLYCFNTLHCVLSAMGALSGRYAVDHVAGDTELRPVIDALVLALESAACAPEGYAVTDKVGGISTREYSQQVLARLRRPLPGSTDSVERALSGLASGKYLVDGRLDGPLRDDDLIDAPWQAKELVHAVAMCLHYVVARIGRQRQRLYWLPAPAAPPGPAVVRVDIPVLDPGSAFGQDRADSRLMEVLARDFTELDRKAGTRWATADVARFLQGEIDHHIQVVPRALRPEQLPLVIFDLDEGLVATESLLYDVTRELIREESSDREVIGHDDYAQMVGWGEDKFFSTMIQQYQIMNKDAEALIREREDRFIAALASEDKEGLVKPGFRKILARLARRGVRLAITSNASHARVLATLKRAGILMYFDESRILTPGGTMRAKPSPEMIKTLLQRERVRGAQCLVIESSRVGVEASIAAGCYTILLVNDYTTPGIASRRGVEVLANAQELDLWLDRFFARGGPAQ